MFEEESVGGFGIGGASTKEPELSPEMDAMYKRRKEIEEYVETISPQERRSIWEKSYKIIEDEKGIYLLDDWDKCYFLPEDEFKRCYRHGFVDYTCELWLVYLIEIQQL